VEYSSLFSIIDHAFSDSILKASTGIEELTLDEHFAFEIRGEAVESDHGSVADDIDNGIANHGRAVQLFGFGGGISGVGGGGGSWHDELIEYL
jgi:hypothetical protein